jgi:hypothetical protein
MWYSKSRLNSLGDAERLQRSRDYYERMWGEYFDRKAAEQRRRCEARGKTYTRVSRIPPKHTCV